MKTKNIITSHRILNASIIWFAIGLLSTLLVATSFASMPLMRNFYKKIFSTSWGAIMILIVSIGIIFWIFNSFESSSINMLIFMFFIFSLIEGFSMSFIFVIFIYYNEAWKITLVLIIPAILIFVMGFLGYKCIFNFYKIRSLLVFLIILFCFTGSILYIIQIKFSFIIYTLLGFLVFLLFSGWQMYKISKMDEIISIYPSIDDTEILVRYGIKFGLSLLIAFFNCVFHIFNLFFNFSRF